MPELAHPVRVAVVWIDWYAYHVARFMGLINDPELAHQVTGIELVGGIGVHAGLKFRENLPPDLPIETLLPGSGWSDAGKFTLARLVWRKLSQLDPQVVLVPGYYTLPGIACALWAKLHGATSVLMTESCAFDHQRTGWRERIKSFGLHLLFDWAVAGGRAHFDYLRQLDFPRNRVVGSYDVVDNQLFGEGTRHLRDASSPQQHGLPSTPYFLYVGRLAEEKNVVTLLQAWLAYRAEGGTWPLVLVGDGPEASSLKALAAASPYPAHVHFPGLRSSRELLPYYAFAGCFVLPSTREPWGLVTNEAMAASLPVLVSDRCGCAPDLVFEGRNGFTFSPLDITAITARLHTMEELPAADRLAMGAESSAIISQYSPAGFGRSIANIAAESRGARRRALTSSDRPADSGLQPEAGGSQ